MSELKRTDIGIAGVLITLAQAFTAYQGSHSTSDDIEVLRREIRESKVEYDTYFVRKGEIYKMSFDIDRIKSDISTIKKQISTLREDLQDQYASEQCGDSGPEPLLPRVVSND